MSNKDSNIIYVEDLTKDLKKDIIGFLNTNGGIIDVGVKEDGSLAESKDSKTKDKMFLELANWLDTSFTPDTTGLISYKFNEDDVFEIRVSTGIKKPYYLKDEGKYRGVYKRIGTSTREATENEILLMIMDSKNYFYETDVSEEQELTFNYFFNQCDLNGISHTKRNLVSLKLLNSDNQYTNLAYLLSDQSNIVLKFAKYDDKVDFVDKRQFSGSLIKIIDQVLDYVNNYNKVSAIIDKETFKRVETKSYPGLSLKEAILNAVSHSNYFIRSNIKIEVYEDHMRITNPGGIYQASLEDILNGVQTYRNPRLVNILDKLGYIENYGSGIPRILNAYKDSVLKPNFTTSDNFFIITLPDLNYNKETNSASYIGLSEFESLLLKQIHDNPGLNARELHQAINDGNITLDMVKNALKRELAPYCEFVGAYRNGGYYIKK